MNFPVTENSDESDLLQLQDYINILRERLPILLITIVLFLLFGAYISTVSPKIYRATATVQIASDSRTVLDVQEVQSEDLKSRDTLVTIEHKIKRASLIASVLNNPEVQNHPHLIPASIRWLPPFKSDPDALPETIDYKSDQELIDMVSDWISVSLRRNTRLIDVSVEHPNREVATLVANTLVEEFNRETTTQKNQAISEALQFLQIESERAGMELQHAETAMQTYNTAAKLKEDIRVREQQIRNLEQRYRDKHPKLIQARRIYHQLGLEFLSEYAKAKRTHSQSAASTGTVYSTAGQIRIEPAPQMEDLDMALAEFETQGSILQRDLDASHELYSSIMIRMKEMDITQKLVTSEVTLIEPAQLPRNPVKPKKIIILAIHFFLGAAVGLILILSLHFLDDKYRSVESLERDTGVRVLAAITQCTELSSPGEEDFGLPAYLADPVAYPGEMFRALHASLTLLGREERLQAIMVTSSLAGEGKSTISANLAAVFAEHDEKTILVDFDIRKSSIHKFFDLDPDQPGLMSHLAEDRPLSECIHHTSDDHLDLLIAGGNHPSSIKYIQEKTIRRIIDELKKTYDRIIIDSAPVLLVSESLFMASHADILCFAVQSANTPKKAVRRALKLLRSIDVVPGGFILNGLHPSHGIRDYYGYKQSYGYEPPSS